MAVRGRVGIWGMGKGVRGCWGVGVDRPGRYEDVLGFGGLFWGWGLGKGVNGGNHEEWGNGPGKGSWEEGMEDKGTG